jgi:hypothetical protein
MAQRTKKGGICSHPSFAREPEHSTRTSLENVSSPSMFLPVSLQPDRKRTSRTKIEGKSVTRGSNHAGEVSRSFLPWSRYA